MPTIKFSFADLRNLVGKSFSLEELERYLSYGKGELDSYDEKSDEVSVSFGDTNLPYLWSVEGVSILIKGILGLETGLKNLDVKKGSYRIIADKGVEKIRPFINGFVAEGKKIDSYFLKQVIQLQEKLCESYGRKRQKISIGLYSYEKIKFPVHYIAVDPKSARFVPLEFENEMDLKQILEQHPKGKEYSWVLKGFKKYPILKDDLGNVLSFPPIINSNDIGKVEAGDEKLFFEVTGNDENSVLLASNIFAFAFQERGFEIYSCITEYSDKKVDAPHSFGDKIKLSRDYVKKILGIDLSDSDIKKILESARYCCEISGKNVLVEIPDYRKDIMHQVDVIEDLGIFYGYEKITAEELKSYTKGGVFEITIFIDRVREICIGLGYQEVMSAVLSNKKTLYENMNVEDFDTVEIDQFMSETYSVVRTWLVPMLMEVLSKNKHVEFPQKIFEQGVVTTRKGEKIFDYERIAIACCNSDADFTEAKQVLDYVFDSFGVKYEIDDFEHSSFIQGRVGRIAVNNCKVGIIGEVHPRVLKNWDVSTPIAVLEINLTALFDEIKKL
ncbi:MAG TPA: phenylalanine--tRNA ligase subunit beta [Candidatus Nanoarchaeia archaeon]|nr:phenylalanine--tRNA ligase subunit beta [Candidatus Nanoarchaeia archaeon]